jgi:hypothetical protein
MSMRSHALVILAVALVPSSCGYVRLPRATWSSAPVGRPVALLMEGSAFDPAARARTARELESELGRPVRVVDTLPVPSDDETKSLALRVVGERSLRYDWREPQCVWDRTLLASIIRDVDAIYRAVIEYSEHERPATDEEWEDLRKSRFALRRMIERPMVREEVVTGTVARSALVLKDAVSRASLHRRRVTLADDGERLDVAAAVAETVHGFGALPAPEWDAHAHRLLKQGCPFLALAIADTQLAEGAREPVQTAAIAAMRASLDRRAARQRADEIADGIRAALRAGDTDRAAAMLADYEASAARKSETARELGTAIAAARGPGGPDAPADVASEVSCHSLCEMHMVEICNTDKVLWSAHRVRWEPTPCGTRREEAFLTQCYQEQWDTGTFDTSCVQPCEASDAGRSRLMAILQEAGCVSGPGPS